MQEIEIGTIICMILVIIGTCMAAGGFFLIPKNVRIVAIGAALMFVGWQLVEFVGLNFIVIAK